LEWSRLVEIEIRGRMIEIIPCHDPVDKLAYSLVQIFRLLSLSS
jgi:hypothetical protein